MNERILNVSALIAAGIVALPSFMQSASAAGESDSVEGIPEIIVTAQKREESAQRVPMSITAASADQLQAVGVVEVRDLEKLVTGFHYTEGQFAAPVYSLRGIGDNDSTLGSRPNVSVYVDEVPLPFAILTRGASLDLERVEVLKGPQGTLFGQNNTGGAINYIAAKPTSEFKAGFDATVGNYATGNIGGFVSGLIWKSPDGKFHPAGWIMSILGAMLLLWAYNNYMR